MPWQLYWLCSGSSWGVTLYVGEGEFSNFWPSLNLCVWNFKKSSQVQTIHKYSCGILADDITMCSSTSPGYSATYSWAVSCPWRRPVTTQSRGLLQPWDALKWHESHWQAQIKTHKQIFAKLSSNLPSTLSFLVGLGSEEKMRLVPLLVWHWYAPASFTNTELMVRLFPGTVSGRPSLYHRNSHSVEMFMWQRNETESSVCMRVCSGDCISWTLGFVSEGSH